jgi:hypothetical protein
MPRVSALLVDSGAAASTLNLCKWRDEFRQRQRTDWAMLQSFKSCAML